jgi:aspartyl-tRNA(Asn)/glutamyl-tRNA(Gln) amidotransferase subunit C
MANPEIDVADVAKLTRLKLSKAETRLFQEQLAHILEYADKLREVDVGGVDPAEDAASITNVFREDKAEKWFMAEDALRNAPHQANGLFLVPKVME